MLLLSKTQLRKALRETHSVGQTQLASFFIYYPSNTLNLSFYGATWCVDSCYDSGHATPGKHSSHVLDLACVGVAILSCSSLVLKANLGMRRLVFIFLVRADI